MAKLEKPLTIGDGDTVQPYALFANSRGGSQAFSISLTTDRVAYALLGDGMDFKQRAYKLIRDMNNATSA